MAAAANRDFVAGLVEASVSSILMLAKFYSHPGLDGSVLDIKFGIFAIQTLQLVYPVLW